MKRKTLSVIAIAVLCSAVLFTSSHAFAETMNALIGKKVEGVKPIYINGIKSAQDAIIIEGTSYIPVRASTTLFGYDVDYDAEKGRILLNKSKESNSSNTGQPNKPEPQPSTEQKPQTGNSGQTNTGTGSTNQQPVPTVASSYMISEDLIQKEIEWLQATNKIYTTIIQAINENAMMTGYTPEQANLLQDYYAKQTQITMQINYLETILQLRKSYDIFK